MAQFVTYTLTKIVAKKTSQIAVLNSGLKAGDFINVGSDSIREVSSVSGGGLVINIKGTFGINTTAKTQVTKKQKPTPTLGWQPVGIGFVAFAEVASPGLKGFYDIIATAIFQSQTLTDWQSASGQAGMFTGSLILGEYIRSFGATRAASLFPAAKGVKKGKTVSVIGQASASFPDTADYQGGTSQLTPVLLGSYVVGST